MRRIIKFLCFLFLTVIFLNCSNSKEWIIGKWYSPVFGLIIVNDYALVHYPRQAPKEIWDFDESVDAYRFDGIYYAHCPNHTDNNLFAKAEMLSRDQIVLKSMDNCFLKHAFGNQITLFRIPNNIKVNFNKLSCISITNGIRNVVDYTPEDLQTLSRSDDLLSLKEQLWMLFNSGVDYTNTSVDRGDNEFITIELRGEGVFYRKKIHNIFIPEYLNSLFLKFNKDLGQKE